MIIVSKTVVD